MTRPGDERSTAGEPESTDSSHTAPGTLAGRYLRRFWQPVYLSKDLPARHSMPIRIVMLRKLWRRELGALAAAQGLGGAARPDGEEGRVTGSGASARDVRVALTFDFDALSNWIGSLGLTSPGPLSRGEFSPIGARRVLALLAEYRARATFFTPGHTALAYPGAVAAVREAGHEIAHHGWIHERPSRLTGDEERRALERGLEVLERELGVRPRGYRAPGWDLSPRTVELLVEHGFEYDSSLMGSDYEPYWCRVGDVASQSEPFRFGTPVALVELPVSWHLDDFPHFEFVNVPGTLTLSGGRDPHSVLQIWIGEFDYLYQQVRRGVLVVTMHPEVIGRGHRLPMLRAFLDHVAGRDGVAFTTCLDYARQWRAGRCPALPPDAARPATEVRT
jgi:peptidoglycan-N-acetylglucosamine deacetylase